MPGSFSIPCGQCMFCRVSKSREWAIRCCNEASMYENNTFVTLTFDDYYLEKMCPFGSLNKLHMKKFMKDLRSRDEYYRKKQGLPFRAIRTLYCGEYGDKNKRPHYHALLFNCDFSDKKFYKTSCGFNLYNSDFLSCVWPYGHAVIGDVTFESAAYVARYVTKKVNGDKKQEHYSILDSETGELFQREQEFAEASRMPGPDRS